MSILVDQNTRLVVQGFTGKEGTFHSEQMLEYGTNVVAGVVPGRGGQRHLDRPVYNTVREAVEQEGANTSIIFVPPPYAASAVLEAADAGVGVVVCITEGIPVRDMIAVKEFVDRKGVRLVGPNCPGVLTPNEAKVGIMPPMIFSDGPVGVVSRSGTLTYEAVDQLTRQGLGQTTAVGIGGDPIIGTPFIDVLRLFEADAETEAVVMIGEIGGTAEEEAAEWAKTNMSKPVFGFIAGRTAPPGRRMGHAGAIVSGGKGTADEKLRVMRESGIVTIEDPAIIGETVKQHFAQVA